MDSSRHAGTWRRLVAVGCLAVGLTACEPSLEKVVAEQRPGVEAVFAKVKALAGPALAAPPVEADAIDLGGAKIALEGDASNALFILAQDLPAPENANPSGPGATEARTVAVCGEALRGAFYGAAAGARAFMTECARTQYVFVLRTRVHEMATVLDNQSFSPGRYEGDVLLFRLSDGALLGGFAVAATNGDEVSVEVTETGTPIDAETRLNSDLESIVFVQIRDKLKQHVPGVIPADPAG